MASSGVKTTTLRSLLPSSLDHSTPRASASRWFATTDSRATAPLLSSSCTTREAGLFGLPTPAPTIRPITACRDVPFAIAFCASIASLALFVTRCPPRPSMLRVNTSSSGSDSAIEATRRSSVPGAMYTPCRALSGFCRSTSCASMSIAGSGLGWSSSSGRVPSGPPGSKPGRSGWSVNSGRALRSIGGAGGGAGAAGR